MRVLKAGAAYFALVFAAGVVLGVVRELWLKPRIGAPAAEIAEVPLMVGLSMLAAVLVVRRLGRGLGVARRLAIGAIALVLLIASELVLMKLVRGQSHDAYLASRDTVAFGAYLVGLALFALMPALVTGAIGSRRYRRVRAAR